MKTLLLGCAVAAAFAVSTAEARITRIEITTVESPTFGGFELAPRNARGNVEYSFDFYILKPVDLAKGAHKMMYEPPNRGRKTWNTFGRVPGNNDPGAITDPAVLATAFLMPRGFTMVWSGWDYSAGTSNAGFNTTITLPVAHVAPTASNPDGTITGPAFEYIVTGGASYALNYPAATLDQAKARLTHRVHLNDAPVEVPPAGWKYNASGTAISLTSGNFVNNDIYEFSYTAKDPTVNGLGFAAIRDWNAWLRYERRDDFGNPNPLARDVKRILTEVVSQPGRLLNDFRHLGFNEAENGKQVFDGLMQWIAAGDGINLNYRFSQPGRTERNRQDHLFVEGVFPFANVMTHDPITRKTDSRLAKCEATRTCPVAAEIYSANEYWVKAASLMTTDPTGRHDLPDSPYSRIYFISSHMHGSAAYPPSKGSCQQLQNPLNSAPVQRALFVAIDEWLDGARPPRTRVPKLRDGTLVPPLPQSAVGFPSIPGVTYTGLKTTRYLFDYGLHFYETGIATINPPVITPPYEDNPANGPIYPSYVPKTDADGNDLAGVRLPDVTVPLATYTGWALRSGPQANDGCESSGQFIPFPRTEAERAASGDPRPSVEARYATFDAYHAKIRNAIDDLIEHRLMLCEDAMSEEARLMSLGLDLGVPAPSGGALPAASLPDACLPHGHHHDHDHDHNHK